VTAIFERIELPKLWYYWGKCVRKSYLPLEKIDISEW